MENQKNNPEMFGDTNNDFESIWLAQKKIEKSILPIERAANIKSIEAKLSGALSLSDVIKYNFTKINHFSKIDSFKKSIFVNEPQWPGDGIRNLIKSLANTEYSLSNMVLNYENFTTRYSKGIYSFLEEELENDNDEIKQEKNKSNIILLDEATKVQLAIKSIFTNNDEIFKIPSRLFEEIVAELMYKKGYEVELTKATRDGGRDIIALKKMDGFINRFLVECKRYKKENLVDIRIIRELAYVVEKEKANKGIIFTTSSFTKDAMKEADDLKYRMELKNGNHVIDYINQYMQSNLFLL